MSGFKIRTFRTLTSILLCLVTVISITGCGYKPGTVKDGVYTNKTFGFTVSPVTDLTVRDNPEDAADYIIALSYSYLQGEKDSFKAEYAMENIQAGLMVASENNPGDYTVNSFVENLEAQQREKIFFTYRTIVNEDVTINGVTFRQLTWDSDGNHQTFLIKFHEDKILFVYISTTSHAVEAGVEDALINSINSI